MLGKRQITDTTSSFSNDKNPPSALAIVRSPDKADLARRCRFEFSRDSGGVKMRVAGECDLLLLLDYSGRTLFALVEGQQRSAREKKGQQGYSLYKFRELNRLYPDLDTGLPSM